MLFIFDMGGVVANSSSTVNVCKKLGISVQDYHSFQLDSEGRNTYQQLSIGSINVEKYWENFSINSKIEINIDYFTALYNPVLNKSLVFIIKKLKEKGYRVVCCTNTIKSHFEEHRRLGNYAISDFVYSSHLMGVKKPNPEFFNKVIDVEQVLVENIYFVDDDKENINAAKKIGMKTHLFVSDEHLKNALTVYL